MDYSTNPNGVRIAVDPATGLDITPGTSLPAAAAIPGATPPTPVQTGVKTDTPVGAAYKLPGSQVNPDEEAARQAALTYATNQSNGTSNVDEAGIRANTIKQFQAEMDATNQLYAEKLAQAKVTGAGRIGSNTAVQGRRGLLGSDFGNAETDTVNTGNDAVYAGIGAERLAAISAITTKSNAAATDAIKEKNDAMASGLDARLKYYADADTRKTTNANAAATLIYGQGLSPTDLTPDQLKQTATNYGVSVDDLTAAYKTVKSTGDAAKITAAKNAEVSVAAGNDVYALQPDGTLKKVATGSNTATKTLSKGQKLFKLDGNGNYVEIAQGEPSTAGGTTTTNPITPAVVAQFQKTISEHTGADTKVDPYQYLNAYNQWTNVLHGTAATFLSKFPPANLLNPQAKAIKNTDGSSLLPANWFPKATGRTG